MKSIVSYLCLFFVIGTTTSLHAQYTDVINSNRPGVSKSAFSVGTNVIQLELGAYSIKEEHTPLRYEVSGFGIDFAARYGLLWEQLEVSIEGVYQNDKLTSNLSSLTVESDRANFRNLTLGAKYLVYDPYKNEEEETPNLYSYHANRKFKWNHLIPAVSVYAGLNYDTKDNPYTAPDVEGVSFKVMVATQHNFTGGWVFVMNLLKDRIGSEYSDFQYILTLTKSVGQQWAVFGEAQGIKSDFYADNLFRLGGAYLWTPNFQLDSHITFNTKDTPSVFNIGIGASYRFDFHQDQQVNDGTSAEDEGERKARKTGKKHKKKTKDEDFNDDDSGL